MTLRDEILAQRDADVAFAELPAEERDRLLAAGREEMRHALDDATVRFVSETKAKLKDNSLEAGHRRRLLRAIDTADAMPPRVCLDACARRRAVLISARERAKDAS